MQALFAGIDREGAVYYVEFTGELDRTIQRLNATTGKATELVHFAARYEWEAYASMSPDGDRLSYSDGESVYLLDLNTETSTVLLQGNAGACDPSSTPRPGISGCFTYRDAVWSPDSRLLAVTKVYYEGSNIVLVDPLSPGIETVTGYGINSAHYADWAPGSDAICALGQYAAPSALFVSRRPDWEEVETFFPEFEETGDFGASVTHCLWLSDANILTAISDEERRVVEFRILNVTNDQDSILTPSFVQDGETALRLYRFGVSDLVLVNSTNPDVGARLASYPAIIDVATRQAYQALDRGDIAVAIVDPN